MAPKEYYSVDELQRHTNRVYTVAIPMTIADVVMTMLTKGGHSKMGGIRTGRH